MTIKKAVLISSASFAVVSLLLSGCQDHQIYYGYNSMGGTTYTKLSTGEILDTSDAGYSYSIEDEHLVITYDNNEVNAPILIADADMDHDGLGVFISDAKTAISYPENDMVTVLFSDDQGETWASSIINCGTDITNSFIGFTSEDTGWLISCNFVGMGTENHFLYTTADGGKTWTLVDSNVNQEYDRLLVGANFLNEKIGFLCFRYESPDFMAPVLTTNDGGITWSKLYLPIPDEYANYRATALTPSYDGNQCVLSVMLTSDDEEVKTINFISDDLGKTFVPQE